MGPADGRDFTYAANDTNQSKRGFTLPCFSTGCQPFFVRRVAGNKIRIRKVKKKSEETGRTWRLCAMWSRIDVTVPVPHINREKRKPERAICFGMCHGCSAV